jgi:hypothetical protein
MEIGDGYGNMESGIKICGNESLGMENRQHGIGKYGIWNMKYEIWNMEYGIWMFEGFKK